jgi:hypothetical protein
MLVRAQQSVTMSLEYREHGEEAMSEPRLLGMDTDLGQIQTEWSLIFDPVEFVERYSRAVRKYLRALVKVPEDADEVAQDFFLWVTRHGFPRAKKDRGRFRDYLKVAVRNAALNFLQRNRTSRRGKINLAQLPAAAEANWMEREWLAECRDCLLNRVWLQLEKIQDRSGKNIYYTAMRVTVAEPDTDSSVQAARASVILGRVIRPAAFRKQVSRGRRMFSELLIREIAQTLDKPTPSQVEEELVDLGLMNFIEDLLPAGWRTWVNSHGR